MTRVLKCIRCRDFSAKYRSIDLFQIAADTAADEEGLGTIYPPETQQEAQR